MHPNSDPASTCHRRCRVGSRKAGSSAWILAVFATWLIQAPVAHADYVADKQEIAAMKARILKNPPTAETLAATPYPGAKLDANCSADFSATNQSEPMVYCYYTHDAVELVKAYIGGAGKPGKGVWTVVDRDDVVENGNVITDHLARYRVPGIMLTPEITSIVVEHPIEAGPYGAKGVGEVCSIPTTPAITNAIYNAVKVRFDKLPVDQEVIARELWERE